jgi:hypothetical protein
VPVTRLQHNKHTTMEYIAPRNVTKGSTAGNGVLCGSAPIMICNNRGIVGSGVFCWVQPKAVSRGLTGQASLSLRLAIARLTHWRSQVIDPGGDVGGEVVPMILSQCIAMQSQLSDR